MSNTPRLDDAGLYALGRVDELENGPNDWRSITAADMERELADAFREGQKFERLECAEISDQKGGQECCSETAEQIGREIRARGEPKR